MLTIRDITPPVLTLPANLVVCVNGAKGAFVDFSLAATDAVSGPLAATVDPPSGSWFPTGTTQVSVSATDTAGNFDQGSFQIR